MTQHSTHGHAAYVAYKQSSGGKSVRGEQLPEWEEQEPQIRQHWEKAAQAAVTHDKQQSR